jgi:hypothetical protein
MSCEIPSKRFSVVEIEHIDFERLIYPTIPTDWIIPEKNFEGKWTFKCPWIDSDDVPDYLVDAVRELRDPPINLTTYEVKTIVTSAGKPWCLIQMLVIYFY